MAVSVNLETRSTYGELVKGIGVQFLEVFNQSVESYALAIDSMYATQGNKRSALFKQQTTDQAIVHFVQKSGTNYLQLTPEGDAFAQDSRFIGYKTSVTPQLFSQSISVTYQALQDRNYSSQLSEFGDIGISAKETMDKTAIDAFNLAFFPQSGLPNYMYGYGDGKPLLSTLHPRKDGGAVQTNVITDPTTGTQNLPLTEANLEIARIQLRRVLDDRGKQTRVGGGKLILLVPPELTKTAVIITRSGTDGKRSGTANNDINIYDGLFTVIESNWLGYTGNPGGLPSTAWFLIDPSVAKLIFLTREGLRTHQFTDPNTLAVTFYGIMRFAIAWCDWRGVVGSKGDSSAFVL